MSLRDAIGMMARGYLGFARSALGLVLALAAAGGASALLAWPLWIVATSHPRMYALSLLGLIAVAVAASSVRARLHRKRPIRRELGPRRVLRLLSLAALAFLALPALALCARLPLLGAPALAVLILLAGFPLFVRSRA